MPNLKPWEWVALAVVAALAIVWYRRRRPVTAVSTGLPATSVPVVALPAPAAPVLVAGPASTSVFMPSTGAPVQPVGPIVAAAPAPRLPQPPPLIYVTPVSQGGLDPRYGNAGENVIT